MSKKVKVGVKAATNENHRLLWTPPAGTVKAQILVDIDHVVEANLVHFYRQESEIIWAYTDDPKDPSEKLSLKPRLSVIVPMLVKDDSGKKQLRYVRGPKSFWNQLRRLNSQNTGGIKGLIIDLTRTDGEFAKYSMMSKGSYGKIEDDALRNQDALVNHIIDQIFEGTVGEVEQMLLATLGTDEYNRLVVGGSSGKKFNIVEEDF